MAAATSTTLGVPPRPVDQPKPAQGSDRDGHDDRLQLSGRRDEPEPERGGVLAAVPSGFFGGLLGGAVCRMVLRLHGFRLDEHETV